MPESSKKKNLLSARAMAKHKKRFLRFFPNGFKDERYIEWERSYKWQAHNLFKSLLNKEEYQGLLRAREHSEIANRALQIESKTNFLFSFEKMALRDALRNPDGSRCFAEGLFNLLYGNGSIKSKFIAWVVAVSELPRVKSRVLSWPIVTFFPFIAQPSKHIILKPTAMMLAANELDYELDYSSKPCWRTYESLLELAELTRVAIADLNPEDYHDLQTFLWVIGSSEYERLAEEI